MPLFSYVVRDKLRKILKGTTEANSEEDLRKYFRKQEYLVFSITKIGAVDTSKEDRNLFEDFKFGKLIFILLLIGGSYLLIKSINRFSSQHGEKKTLVKVEPAPKEEPVIKTPIITTEEIVYKIEQEPEQEIVTKNVTPEPEQKEGVVKIALKREAKKVTLYGKNSTNYKQAREYYTLALGNRNSSKATSYFRKAIKYAQQALQAKEGTEEEIRAFIRNCRKMILKR